ncbi:hypothetical protein JX580_01405 [Thiomicrospira microaerophila]|uniref:hypothetical protein n=1 Tax=Thiomicrospira microaerophila TaxID=406020 RepID=UPI00200C23F0|nr:hypothetical protein [Thiomicrospira microaerophila]UQB42579.1 hypothetical protein JX580_01405 [Thiomicrospira microaerophila]
MNKVCLIGWPGSGKTRFHTMVSQQAQALGLSLREAPGLVWDRGATEQAWLVVDARHRIEDERERAALFNAGDALVLMFWQEVELANQAWWLKQLKSYADNKPYALVMQAGLTDNELLKLMSAAPSAIRPDWPMLARVELTVPRLVLEHFTFVLDAMQRDPEIQLWRAVGVLDTLEYANRVAIEAGRSGFYQYDAGDMPAGCLRLEARALKPAVLEEWLSACYAPGG